MSSSSGKIKDAEEREFLLDFIEVYRSLPSLWDVKSTEYNDRYKKAEQYEVLLQKYREKYPRADKAEVTRKINSLRTNFRRELRRLNSLNKNGSCHNQPNLWYFNELSFVKNSFSTSPRPKRTQDKTNYDEEEEEEEEEEEPLRKKFKKHMDPTVRLLAMATERLENRPDNFKKMADVWASKLRNMNANQQLYAEKFINDILFEGVLNNLHRDAVQINPQRPSTPITFPCHESDSKRSFKNINPQITPQIVVKSANKPNRVFVKYVHSIAKENCEEEEIVPEDD